ncbi:GNAT family acetyltransferase YjcF [hydrothermal vent metagenome]|uniref:GNAT family acetyltransferase YjcF n=1 Tax=hydrothermal vent metagenome TaxID=652676 RepID=A0A3B0RUF2_9ZZZZ
MTAVTIIKITSEEELDKCFQIRTVVFVEEQNVPMDEEIDGLDGEADHYLLCLNDRAVATARVRHLDEVAKIERVAVLCGNRGLNIGRRLMEYIMADIQGNPAIRVMKLGAQIQVIEFYEKLGFTCYGDEFLDAGIRHRWMMRRIT